MSLFAISGYLSFLRGWNFGFAYLLSCIVYAIAFSRFNPKAKWVTAFSIVAAAVLIIELGTQIMRQLARTYPDVPFEWVSILASLLFVVFAVFVHRYSMNSFSDIPVIAVILSLITDGVSLTLVLAFQGYQANVGSNSSNEWFWIVVLGLFFITVSSYFSIYFLCRERANVVNLKATNRMLEADREMFSVSSQSLEDMRKIRHDLKNQYTMMEMLLKDRKYDELEKCFQAWGSNVSSLISIFDCGNPAVNSIINMEMNKARAENITLVSKVMVPASLPFEDADLCSFIAIITDNAIEAVKKDQIPQASIMLSLLTKEDFLYLCITNPLPEGTDKNQILKLESLKKNTAEETHGLGHVIVNRLAGKYNGFVNYSVDHSLFIAEVMLDMKWKTSAEEKH
jgi:hypothetical protein